MSLYEFRVRADGHAKREEAEWHRLRVLATLLLSPHTKKGAKIKPSDLIALPSDVITPTKRMDTEQIARDVARKIAILEQNRMN